MGTKRTIWGKYKGVIVGPDGTALRVLSRNHRNPKDAIKQAREVLDIAVLIAVQKMEHDTKDN